MAFEDMWFEISGEMAIPAPLAQTKLNEALGQIYDDGQQPMWSFQIREADNWLTPGLMFATGWPSDGGPRRPHRPRPHDHDHDHDHDHHHRLRHRFNDGLIHAEPFSPIIRGNKRARRAWKRLRGRPFMTEMQIRSPFFSLYNIIHWDPEEGTLLLDRPWMEPTELPRQFLGGIGPWPWPFDDSFDEDEEEDEHRHDRDFWQPFFIYQAYFPTPTADFKRFFEIKDTMNSGLIDYWSYSQRDLTDRDPQRIIFDLPAYAVFRGWDERGKGTEFESATLGHPLYELWPHPLSQMPYTFSSLRRGPMLEHPHDKVPAPLTEDMVKWKCREALYLFKESQRGETVQRGSGSDWKFLSQAAAAEYQAARDRIGKRDVAIVDLFFSRFLRNAADRNAPFATITGQLNIGGW
ncbi:MAG: hypothetical protein C5B54_02435 [Acidobacteria bacterium]|nr:MAG: hypothetical protein C5B54_02435 [Acidobacteriota bacterium]